MRTRNWSIRSKIIALVAVPLTALLALWIFATSLTAGPAFNLLSAQTLLDTVGRPGEVLVGELQHERRLSVVYLSGTEAAVTPALTTQRAATDRAVADFRRSAGSDDAQGAASQTLRERIRQIFADLDGLAANRGHIDERDVDVVGAQGMYDAIIDTGFQMFAATATFNDEQIDREIRGLTTIGRGQEFLSRVDSLLAGANTAGQFSTDVRERLLQSILTSKFLFAEGVTEMPPGERTAYQRLSTSEAFSRLRIMQQTLINQSRAGVASPVTQDAWQPAYDTAAQQVRAFEINATDALAERAQPVAIGVLVRLAAAGLLGLIAVVVSIIVSVRVGRSIVGRLRRLRGEALEMADERLPTVVRRLRRGETLDVDVETPPLEYGGDEIGQLGRAFNEVQRTAVQSAVEEAGVRRGINEVFLNIARRSQTLLHRQLALLDRMERRVTEPDELEDLYRVDHLATRMRRHAEDLVILAGAAPGRGWRNPVPLIDVVRGAISEVEDYKRIDITTIEASAVLGRAVGDVIHLLAELLENATSFSPPHTRVQVTGQILPNGYALEIDDRGLGMSPEAIDEANRKLTEPPDFDPSNSARLGLFVVAQLAHRHGIRVSLRASAYGGITAVVLVPGELISGGPGPLALPAGPSPADQSWDRPLVGTGSDNPARRSLADLQWQGGDDRRSVSVPGRHVTLNGAGNARPERDDPGGGAPPFRGNDGPGGNTMPLSPRPTAGGLFGGPVPRPRAAPDDPVPAITPDDQIPVTGPTPSSVAEGLTADGLVRRRRTVPRRAVAKPEDAPTASHPQLDATRLSQTVTHLAAPNQDASTPAAPNQDTSTLAPPTITPDGLPKRVRQASLAPQLRAIPVDETETQSVRSPEQIREIMSALQRGTNRGRLAAAGIDPDATAAAAPVAGFDEAATVSLPIVRDKRVTNDHDSRPDKDA